MNSWVAVSKNLLKFVVVLLLAALARLACWNSVFAGGDVLWTGGPDAYYHQRRIELAFHNQVVVGVCVHHLQTANLARKLCPAMFSQAHANTTCLVVVNCSPRRQA